LTQQGEQKYKPGLRRIVGTKRFFAGSELGEANKRKWSNQELQKPKSPSDLLSHTAQAMEEIRRVARRGMILKGQDLIVNKPFWWSFHVICLAQNQGLGLPSDVLVQYSFAYRLRDHRWKKQHHFRRAHAYYIIWKW
jgi:hypothetical protein